MRERPREPILPVFLDPEPMRDGELFLSMLGTTPDDSKHYVHTYHFGIFLDGVPEMVGDIDLRVNNERDLVRYAGHIGYAVDPLFRGRQLASRSLRLLFPLARRHGFRELWITCDPENIASQRTCLRAGAVWHETVEIPPRHELYALGLRQKHRYRLRL